MNKTISLAAIAMVAVIMGLSSFAPAMADPNNPQSQATDGVCHLDDDSSMWIVIWVNGQGQLNGHIKHGDTVVNNAGMAFWCVDNQDGTVVEPEPDP